MSLDQMVSKKIGVFGANQNHAIFHVIEINNQSPPLLSSSNNNWHYTEYSIPFYLLHSYKLAELAIHHALKNQSNSNKILVTHLTTSFTSQKHGTPNSNDIESPIILLESIPDAKAKPEVQNKAIVEALYKALANGQIETVTKLLACDLEWWFHGPPKRHHMMRVLTGESTYKEFTFEPKSITVIGDDSVIVEGWEGAHYWVHLWTLKDGLITKFREYFNTWLTVQELRPWEVRQKSATLWQSQPRDLYERSLPALMIAM